MAEIDISTLTSKTINGEDTVLRKQWSEAKTIITSQSGSFEDTLIVSIMGTDGSELIGLRLDERMRVELIQVLLEG